MKRAAVVALYMLALSGCADFIRPLSKAGMDAPTALVNGRLHGDCQPHKPWSGSSGSDVKVDNFGQANGCPSEAAVFARDNAMGLKDAVALFTDSKNDLVDVPMIRPYPVPLNIFVMAGDLMTGSVPQRS